VGDRTGRLAPGLDADLLVVDGDPVTDPGALERVRLVVCRGREVPLVP
jgi:imidazolonepropionase-like amidohydrolase